MKVEKLKQIFYYKCYDTFNALKSAFSKQEDFSFPFTNVNYELMQNEGMAAGELWKIVCSFILPISISVTGCLKNS